MLRRFFRNFFKFWAFFSHLKSSWPFLSIFFDVLLILGGFWTIWGGFWEDFSIIFYIFLEKANFVKNIVFPSENCYF